MKYFDLHCDTPTVMYAKKNDFSDGKMHINEKALSVFEEAYQLCAVFMDDSNKNSNFSYFENVYDYFMPIAEKVRNFNVILSSEGGRCIEGDINKIDSLAQMGLRVFGLVWNGENELATGAFKDNSAGLSLTGKAAVRRLEQLGITPDCSHLSDAGFYDLARITEKPFIATHSNCRSVYSNPRNLTDEQIRIIIDKKGLIGLNLFPSIICDNPSLTDLIPHAEKILSLGGETCIAMGGDLDGISSVPKGFTNVADYLTIADMFEKEFGKDLSNKIMYGNAAAFFWIKG